MVSFSCGPYYYYYYYYYYYFHIVFSLAAPSLSLKRTENILTAFPCEASYMDTKMSLHPKGLN